MPLSDAAKITTTNQWIWYVNLKLANIMEAEELIPAAQIKALASFNGPVGTVDFSDPVNATLCLESENLRFTAEFYLQSGARGAGSYDVTNIHVEVTA